MKISFSPPDISELEIAEVAEALRSGWITTGPRTKLLESRISEWIGTPKCVCLNSQTACAEMALRLLGIGEGDEVITSAYTYTASAAVVCHVGATLKLVDIQSDKAANVAQEINAEYGESMAYGFGADATSEQSVLALSRGVDEIFGRVDLLVYSAGIAKAAFISDFQLGDFDRSLQVNLVGYFLCAREFSRLMIRDGIQGRIIQINSKSGKVGSKHNSGYSAAKFGGVGLTQSLALDLAEYGITVHSLMLGNLLKSPMFQSLLPQYATKLGIKPDQVEQYYIDKVPLKRGCDYQDVLNMLLFYASPKASYCTGQSINVTGGQVMF